MDGFDRHAKAITNLYHVLDPIHPLQDIKLISVEKEKMQSIKVAHETHVFGFYTPMLYHRTKKTSMER